jgi:hypothetical protein
MEEEEISRWRRAEQWRLRSNPDLEPPRKQIPTGRLKLSLPHHWSGRANWSEGSRGSLETKLRSVFNELELRADADDRRAEERRQREEGLRRQEEIRRERARLLKVEEARIARLRREIDTWQLAISARQYVSALRQKAVTLSKEDGVRVTAWCDWIESWTARLDPTLNVEIIASIDIDTEPGEHLSNGSFR